MGDDLIETFKIIDRGSNYDNQFFLIFIFQQDIYCQTDLKK